MAAKPVVRSRPLNITDSLEGWETQGKYGTLELSSEYSVNGNQTLLMTSPTRIDNLKLAVGEVEINAGASATITAEIINSKQPWLALVMPEGRLADKVEIHTGGNKNE